MRHDRAAPGVSSAVVRAAVLLFLVACSDAAEMPADSSAPGDATLEAASEAEAASPCPAGMAYVDAPDAAVCVDLYEGALERGDASWPFYQSVDALDASDLRAVPADHIFPQGYIAGHLPHVTNSLRVCVLNRTLIDKATNIRIGKRAPSDYLKEIQEALGSDFEKLLAAHLLPVGGASPLLKNNFDEFLNLRENLLGQKIKEVTS